MNHVTPRIAVTGSTGKLGGRVARRLASLGIPQWLVVRDPSRAPALPDTKIRVTTYADFHASVGALDAVETLFMVSASESPDRVKDHFAFIDAAARAGVQRVVYLSFFGASPTATFTLARDHWQTEEHLRKSGMKFVVVRDNLYLDFLPLLVSPEGTIAGPAGNGLAAAVAQDDIADSIAAILRAPATHDGRTYELTGPEALTLDEIARVLSAHEEHAITFVNETIDEAYASRAKYGAPKWQLDAWVSTYTAIAAGELARVTGDVERLTGHPPMSLSTLLAKRG
ncbi:SDR family oxidoreductase [Labilithrix luteola]|uniref:SDR family oxidoreductase n=1 Tax=Labilithrix luteola TaxID=1391654 RepID=UPI0011BAB45A|nr:SDR family oxidoreductase [Labilithrix luteola]